MHNYFTKTLLAYFWGFHKLHLILQKHRWKVIAERCWLLLVISEVISQKFANSKCCRTSFYLNYMCITLFTYILIQPIIKFTTTKSCISSTTIFSKVAKWKFFLQKQHLAHELKKFLLRKIHILTNPQISIRLTTNTLTWQITADFFYAR